MPARIVVQLEPVRDTAVPAEHTGPAVYAAVLDGIRDVDEELARALHDRPPYKPFAISPLLAGWGTSSAEPKGAARFEVSLLIDALVAPVLMALVGRAEHLISTTAYRTASVLPGPVVPYDALLRRARPRISWTFQLLTPVSFATASDEGVRRERPWPDAVRVLGNLASRWETFAGELTSGVAAAVTDHAETVGGDVRIVQHLVKADSSIYRRGAVGSVQYRLAAPRSIPREAVRAVDALASFAEYAGFGDRTAVGMGHVRLLEESAGIAQRPR